MFILLLFVLLLHCTVKYPCFFLTILAGNQIWLKAVGLLITLSCLSGSRSIIYKSLYFVIWPPSAATLAHYLVMSYFSMLLSFTTAGCVGLICVSKISHFVRPPPLAFFLMTHVKGRLFSESAFRRVASAVAHSCQAPCATIFKIVE